MLYFPAMTACPGLRSRCTVIPASSLIQKGTQPYSTIFQTSTTNKCLLNCITSRRHFLNMLKGSVSRDFRPPFKHIYNNNFVYDNFIRGRTVKDLCRSVIYSCTFIRKCQFSKNIIKSKKMYWLFNVKRKSKTTYCTISFF